MYTQSPRFSQVRKLFAALAVVAIVGGGALIGLGVVRFAQPVGLWLIVVGGLIVLTAVVVATTSSMILRIDANTIRMTAAVRDVQEVLESHRTRLDAIAESTRLSDAAKSITHRQEERSALRQAIHSEIQFHDWEAAKYLISEMARRFGYKEEAAELQSRVDQACGAFYRTEVDKVIPHIHQLFDQHQWDRASRELARLLKAFPNEGRFVELEKELVQRKAQRKEELIKAFTMAVERDDIDIDAGMRVLKELDQYLEPNEAATMEESARKVVKGKLLQLGVRFRFAVTEARWRDALEAAVAICEEFPNSKMASEVQDRMDALRARAGVTGDVEVTSSRPVTPSK
jgi:hypothetical protein